MVRSGIERSPVLNRWLVALLSLWCGNAVLAQDTVLHLRSGDRISGAILSENAAVVIVSNAWARAISIPRNEITRRDPPEAAKSAPAAVTTVPAIARPVIVAPPRWKGDIQVGADFRTGTSERNLYFGRLRLAYERPYQFQPGKSFRNGFDYSIEYSKTDGRISSDRMSAIDKTAADLTLKWYAYNLAGAGYDHIKRIDFQYEIGPGIGYHLFARTNSSMNLEGGLNYQAHYYEDDTEAKDVYFRLAEELSWKLGGKLALTERLEFFPRLNLSDFRLRFELTLSYELWKNLLLNWTLLDLYDSAPAAMVEKNELQIRTSFGLKF